MCPPRPANWNLAERLEQWRPELKALAVGLALETDPVFGAHG